ncbi:MAG: RsiV family protein [Oligosphaeraceae bacterium]
MRILTALLLALLLSHSILARECPRNEGTPCPPQCRGNDGPCLSSAWDGFTEFFHALGSPATSPAALKELTVRRQATVLYCTEKVVSFQCEEEGYLGGAHGFRNVRVATLLRGEDGPRKLTLEDLGTPEQRKALEEKLLQALQEEYGRRGDTPPQDGHFPRPALTENFYYDAQGLHFVFNRYEIDCHAAGEFHLCVDWPLPPFAQ